MADVVMPQMGESIAEGTIVRWIKKVGDTVERDEPLFEISTDKVDAEIPAPAEGVLIEIRHAEGETVPVNSVVAVIGAPGSQPEAPQEAPGRPAKAGRYEDARPADRPRHGSGETAAASAEAEAGRDMGARSTAPPAAEGEPRTSPLVRKLSREHDVDLSQVKGTGLGGRVTKDDILAFVDARSAVASARPSPPAKAALAPTETAVPGGGAPGQLVPMSVMRKKIAEHMIASRRTSAHVHSVFEVNFARVAEIREAKKAEYERAGAKLTYMAFIIKAVTEALRAVPVLNASVEGDHIRYHQEVNIGVAVALDWGLIVPVIRDAGEKNLLGLSRALADLADRARHKQLKPDEVAHGTFTVTNPGALGAQFGLPIINQPQVAILGVGNVEKRPVVIDDAIAIRPMAHLALGYDHRIVDGAVADHFMAIVKRSIESWDPEAV